MHRIKVQQFEGPLELLLELIENQKLTITEVALADVTDQYIALLHQAGDRVRPEDLADFLVVAARLLLIKSRALLPYLKWEEDESEKSLADQLKMYQAYADAAKKIQQLIGQKKFSFARERLLITDEIGFAPPPGITTQRLAELFRQVVRQLQPTLVPQTDVIRRTVSIQEKIRQIQDRLNQATSTNFFDLIRGAKDQTEIIVSFLAVLELVKQRSVAVQQEGIFSDFVIKKV